MIEELIFLSLAGMKRVRPALDTLVISILDRSEEQARPPLGGFRSVLVLNFEDTYEELKLAAPGAWPDEPTPEEHARFCQGAGELVPTLTDAKRIFDFLTLHRFSDEKLKLVVHCHGGISRSAAVAEWISVNLWLPIANGRSTEYANLRLMRLLDKAAGKR
ncbi:MULTISPECIES: hypothetical protein [unclassified Variovorax]|uniref:hypothetical protein n=1 Tax=unclassified Variovorax TaxID=663243 RepID=UPI00076C666E|nr:MULTISPECIES: hypothetical protein [unclassified Variovorax]KWT98282.1 hypothetical protein APY03_0417 [Variovorax sp. WDL1]PNG50063.1 hypothetical protein CHC06_05646 [Variovorax sp. B2]PNG50935.1 hypothetical protein CHC07_05551 [Variovorax sp. B4]VTV17090.1 hypothetical protein WDL1P1_00059 [Variovorax sp. WDL1]